MAAAADEVLKYIATNEIKWIDLQFFDITGLMHRTTLSHKEMDDAVFTKGVAAADLHSVFGKSAQGELVLLPDPETMARLPWEPATVRIIADVTVALNSERYIKDPRYASKKLETNMEAMGIKNSLVGASTEFYIFDTVTVDRTTVGRGAGTLMDSRESVWGPSPLASIRKGAFVAQPFDGMYGARVQIAETMEENFGFAIDAHRHGRSQTAQESMDIHEYPITSAADAFGSLKFVVRNLANAVSASTTFMPYPIQGEKGSSHHIHQSLWKSADNNMFYDANEDYAQLSQSGRYYVGGLLEHAAALALFTNPTANSYRRLAADPKYVGWSSSNRNAVVQVPYLKKNYKEGKRISYTSADPSLNPHIAYAAVVAAGLDGIKSKIDPGDPLEENEEEPKKRKWAQLPESLYEAIEALETDPKFIKGVISSELLEDYLDLKLAEHKSTQKSITPWELENYFNI